MPIYSTLNLCFTPQKRMDAAPQIQCNDLSRSWKTPGGRHEAFRALDLVVRPGDYLSIQGPSGAGKSTLLRILGGLDRQYQGELRLFGQDVRTLSDAKLSRLRNEKIAFVFQAYQLLPHLRVEENILLPFTWRKKPPTLAVQKQRVTELLRALGIEDKRDAFPDTLSGGQQQRVAIARALVMQPELLLCDEITGNLDAVHAADVMTLLEGYRAESGCSILIVSHDPTILQRAEQRFLLRDGALVSQPTRERTDNSDSGVSE